MNLINFQLKVIVVGVALQCVFVCGYLQSNGLQYKCIYIQLFLHAAHVWAPCGLILVWHHSVLTD